MSIHVRKLLLLLSFPGLVAAQSTLGSILDASNTPFNAWRSDFGTRAEIGGTFSTGSVSVQELRRPLEGKPLSILLKAQKFLEAGEHTKAFERLRESMRYPEAEPFALAILGSEYLKQGNFETARPMLESASQMLPGVAGIHSNLAWALLVQGRNEAALKEARRALQLDPGHSRYRYVLGRVLLAMNRRDEAEFHLRKAAVEFPAASVLLEKYFQPE